MLPTIKSFKLAIRTFRLYTYVPTTHPPIKENRATTALKNYGHHATSTSIVRVHISNPFMSWAPVYK